MLKLWLVSIALLLAAPAAVLGHSWYDADCCSDKDCFPAKNVRYYAYDHSFTADVHGHHVRVGPEVRKLLSLDADYHACIRARPGMEIKVKCWYVPGTG